MLLGFTGDRQFDETERAFIGSIADQSSAALQRAWGLQREQAARARSEQLQRVTAALGAAITQRDVTDVLVREAIAASGADACVLYLVASDASELRLQREHGYRGDFPPDAIPLADPYAAAMAQRERRPLWYSSAHEYAAAHPAFAAAYRSLDYEASVFLPLVYRGDSLGVLALSFERRRVFETAYRDYLLALASQCVQALVRTRLFEREQEIARGLREAILPARLPRHPRTELAARYLPVPEAPSIGGDWYEAVLLPDDRLVLAIGDVAGHGIQAARAMGQLRNTVRVLALEGLAPYEIAQRLNELALLGERFGTLALVSLSVAAHACEVICAGHPPPLLVSPARGASFIDGGRTLALGVSDRLPPTETATAAIEPGATILLYTDGLVEGRDTNLTDGLSALLDAAGTVTGPLGLWLDDLLRRARHEPQSDDIAVVALRLTD